jgi:hypothetical protein
MVGRMLVYKTHSLKSAKDTARCFGFLAIAGASEARSVGANFGMYS